MSKSSFESHDLTRAVPVTNGSNTDETKFSGIERRRAHRRDGTERRGEIRFEFNKDERRGDTGRRDDDHKPTFW